jgi:hypothetical protein
MTFSGQDAAIDGNNIVAAHGTFTSKPLILLDKEPYLYSDSLEVTITYSGGALAEQPLVLYHLTPRPGPPSDAEVTLSGVVTDFNSHEPVPDVVVEVLDGPDAGRRKLTDEGGAFRLKNLKTGRFRMSFSREGYQNTYQSVFLTADKEIEIQLYQR